MLIFLKKKNKLFYLLNTQSNCQVERCVLQTLSTEILQDDQLEYISQVKEQRKTLSKVYWGKNSMREKF